MIKDHLAKKFFFGSMKQRINYLLTLFYVDILFVLQNCRFVVSLVYFAISLNPSHLSGDRLMNVFLTGVAEFPGFALAYYLPKMIGRVRSTSILYILCGVSCVIAPLLRKRKKNWLVI